MKATKKKPGKAAAGIQQQAQPQEAKAEMKPEPELHQASRRGDAEQVTKLLEAGHDPTVSVGVAPGQNLSLVGCEDPCTVWALNVVICHRQMPVPLQLNNFVGRP